MAEVAVLAATAHGTRRVLGLSGSAGPRLLLQAMAADAMLVTLPIAEGGGTVLVTLFDPAVTRPLDPHALSQVFDPTPAESCVAARVAEGGTVSAVAISLAVRESTVRTHLRSLLAKLGVSSKTEIVRLPNQAGWMAQVPTPQPRIATATR